jgi:hypothetical protein
MDIDPEETVEEIKEPEKTTIDEEVEPIDKPPAGLMARTEV